MQPDKSRGWNILHDNWPDLFNWSVALKLREVFLKDLQDVQPDAFHHPGLDSGLEQISCKETFWVS